MTDEQNMGVYARRYENEVVRKITKISIPNPRMQDWENLFYEELESYNQLVWTLILVCATVIFLRMI